MKKKKEEKREDRGYIDVGIIRKKVRGVVKNFKYTMFVGNDYLCMWNYGKMLGEELYTYISSLLLYAKDPRCHNLYSS